MGSEVVGPSTHTQMYEHTNIRTYVHIAPHKWIYGHTTHMHTLHPKHTYMHTLPPDATYTIMNQTQSATYARCTHTHTTVGHTSIPPSCPCNCTFSESCRVRLWRLVGCAWWIATEWLGSSSEAYSSARKRRERESGA